MSLTGNLDVTDRALIIDVQGRNFLGGLRDSARNKKSPLTASPWKEEYEEKAIVVVVVVVTVATAVVARATAATPMEEADKAGGKRAKWVELFTTLTGRRR